jgi:hypothetical protein
VNNWKAPKFTYADSKLSCIVAPDFFRPAVSVNFNAAFATPSVSFLAGRKISRRFGCNQAFHQYKKIRWLFVSVKTFKK